MFRYFLDHHQGAIFLLAKVILYLYKKTKIPINSF